MAEGAHGKNGDGDEGRIVAVERAEIKRHRHLGDFEFLLPEHPLKGERGKEIDMLDVDALGMHAPVGERARMLVILRREGELQIGHGDLPR